MGGFYRSKSEILIRAGYFVDLVKILIDHSTHERLYFPIVRRVLLYYEEAELL